MREILSAWMDGELEREGVSQILSQLKRDANLRASWDCYYLIGDALRGVQGPDLCARICSQLQSEPTVLAARGRSAAQLLHWRPWKVAASIVAVAFLGWVALPGLQHDVPQIAATPAPEVKQFARLAGEDARNYLFAHNRFSPAGAIQGVTLYVRTVAEERSADGW